MVKWSLQIPTWKNWFKAVSGNISYTAESAAKSVDFLYECESICKEVCEDKGIEFDRLLISELPILSGFYYFQFKKNFDGKINDFEETYLMDILLQWHNHYGEFNDQWQSVYENFAKHFTERPPQFNEGMIISQKKNADPLKSFKLILEDIFKDEK